MLFHKESEEEADTCPSDMQVVTIKLKVRNHSVLHLTGVSLLAFFICSCIWWTGKKNSKGETEWKISFFLLPAAERNKMRTLRVMKVGR
jgi:hypothetical protein